MTKENVINYIKDNIKQIENAKSDYAFSNNTVREILTNIYCKVSAIDESAAKGKWKIKWINDCCHYYCSFCNEQSFVLGNYCPNCGEEMEMEE